jgi:hypothetical protein
MEMNTRYPADEQNNNESKREHACPYCQKLFLKMDDLNLHVLTKHTGSYSLRKTSQNNQDDAPATTAS